MRKLLTSICFLFGSAFVFAQHMPMVGDEWYYEQYGPTGNPYQGTVFNYRVEKDTLINGKSAIVINQYQLHKTKTLTKINTFYFLDSSGSVSTLDNGKEIPFFNFNAEQGDSVWINYLDFSLTKLTTTKVYIDTVILDKFGLRQFYFKTQTSNMVSERVFKYGFINDFNQTATFYPSAPISGVFLRCYNSNSIQIKTNPNQDCDFLQPQFFNLTSQYYYSMQKPHASIEAPFYRLIYEKDNNDASKYWLRYEDKNGNRIPEGDVQVKEDKQTQKVFVWKNGWHLLYDLKAKKGDTIFSTAAISNPLWINNNGSNETVASWSYIIDSVYESFNQIIQITKPVAGSAWTMPSKIYEGMGSDIAFLGLPAKADTIGKEGSLRCYFNQNGINYRNQNMGVQTCNSLFTSLNEPSNETKMLFNVYPNPASSTITIQGLNVEFEASIYNMIGGKVANFSSPTYNISHLSNGIYMLSVSQEGLVGHKILVIEHD